MTLSEPIFLDTPEQQEAGCKLLEAMYPDKHPALLREEWAQMRSQGWRMAGVLREHWCLAIVITRLSTRMYCGRFMQLDSLWIDESGRRDGLGRKLLEWAEQQAREAGCSRVSLDSYVENFPGHQFFYRQGYFIRGYHFNKLLNPKS